MDRVVCLLIVLLVAFCSALSFIIGRMILRKQTMEDILDLHAKLSGIKNADRAGRMIPQEFNLRVADIVQAYIKENFPDELVEAIDDYVDSRKYLENLD